MFTFAHVRWYKVLLKRETKNEMEGKMKIRDKVTHYKRYWLNRNDLLCIDCSYLKKNIKYIVLAHLNWKLKWAFLISFCPAYLCPSVCLSFCRSVNVLHVFFLESNSEISVSYKKKTMFQIQFTAFNIKKTRNGSNDSEWFISYSEVDFSWYAVIFVVIFKAIENDEDINY